MANFYMAITVKGDKNEGLFSEREKPEVEIGYYSYAMKISDSDNIKSVLEGIGGLVSANICPTKKKAAEMVTHWNDNYKANGQYLFDTPRF